MPTSYKAIILLCLLSSACSENYQPSPPPPLPPPPPEWTIKEVVPLGDVGAVGCSRHMNTREQLKEARSNALSELAMQQGINVKSILRMQANSSGHTVAEVRTVQGTRVTIKAKTDNRWNDPAGNKTCVWLKKVE